MTSISPIRPWRGSLERLWWAGRALRKEVLGFRFDYPIETVAAAGPKESLHYYVYNEDLFFDAMELDAEGIPVHRARTFGATSHPAYVSWYGLVDVERYARGLDPSRMFLRQVDWLVSHALRRDDGAVVWPYTAVFEEGRASLKPPWICAMAQGLAISLLVRGHRAIGRPELLDLCHAATRVFAKSLEDGGVRTLEDGYTLYEEYPVYPLPEGAGRIPVQPPGARRPRRPDRDQPALQLFNEGVAGLRHTLKFWNYRDKWSWYGSHGYLCPPHYNKLNAALLASVARVAGDATLRSLRRGVGPTAADAGWKSRDLPRLSLHQEPVAPPTSYVAPSGAS